MRSVFLIFFLLLGWMFTAESAPVELGVEVFFSEGHIHQLKAKRVALITNHTGVDRHLRSTIDRLSHPSSGVKLVALFAPEHGINGQAYAWESVDKQKKYLGIPVYSLHGKTRRPTESMLQGIDVIIYDIQDIGARSYTYTTTLFYVMEEAAKRNLPVIVLDRPNPINGLIVDGPMLEESWRSYIGYINVPYCHGMTIGELAQLFNEQYSIGCSLKVIPMRGWKRSMSYQETGLHWIPTSPQIPEADTPLFFVSTGILGELGLVNIGIGYTLPFKVVGAPWINANQFAAELNAQKLPGVFFLPFHYRPFFGAYQGKDCQGVKIVVSNRSTYRPLAVQYMLIGILKNLYPEKVRSQLLAASASKKELFCKANGNSHMLTTLLQEKYTAWKLILYQKEEREAFLAIRKKYLLYP